MKKLIYLFIFLLFACKEESKLSTNNTIAKAENEMTIDLEIYDFNGLQKFLSTESNKTYIVNFWATWCAPCVKELPYFEEIRANYKDKNVEVILVSLDFSKQYETKLKPFIKTHKLQSTVVALNDKDSNSWIPKVSENWSGAIPATLIFNKEKRQFYEQSFNYQELETELKQFIN